MIFQTQATITKAETMSKGLRLRVDTQETLAPDEKAKIFDLQDKHLYIAVKAFDDGEIKKDELDIPDVVPEFKNEKSPSQRLRAVFFRLWEQNKEGLDFEVYYRTKMDKLIEHYKEKLN